jgi:hypothetical protein
MKKLFYVFVKTLNEMGRKNGLKIVQFYFFLNIYFLAQVNPTLATGIAMGQFYNIKMCYPSNYPNFSVIK